MICFYVRLRALGTRTDVLTDLNLASKKGRFALDFYRECFYVGRVKYNIYNPTGILYAEIIFLSAKTDAAAFIRLALLAMQKSTGKTSGVISGINEPSFFTSEPYIATVGIISNAFIKAHTMICTSAPADLNSPVSNLPLNFA